MASDVENSWKTTVIISSSPQCDESSQILLAQQHRIRRSDSTLPSTFIFPLSATAFLLTKPEDFAGDRECEEPFEKVKKFLQVHGNSFLLLQAPIFEKKEWAIISSLQKRFFGCNLKVLLVHNNADAVKQMLVIAKATSKPQVEDLRERISSACFHIIENSSVWRSPQVMNVN